MQIALKGMADESNLPYLSPHPFKHFSCLVGEA